MKSIRSFLVFSLLGLLLGGCAYIDVTAPGQAQNTTQYTLGSDDFTVLGRVNATGEVTLWFGLVMTGGKGYQELLEQSKTLGGDSIMDYSFDMEQTSVLMFIYSRYAWKATGLAVKYSDRIYKVR